MTAPRPCVDHLGRVYPSVQARARAFGLLPATVRTRLASGATLGEALAARDLRADRAKPCEVNGVLYPTRQAAADALGMTTQGLAYRLRSSRTQVPSWRGQHARWRRIAAVLDLWRAATGRDDLQEAAE